MVVDYQKGKIYTLRSHQTDKVYVGSTCNPLRKRLYQHKDNYKRGENVSSRGLAQFDDCYIELYEAHPCQTKAELNRREGEIIRSIECVNKQIAGRTIHEWRADNHDTLKEKRTAYNKERKEEKKAYNKAYYEENRDEIKEKVKAYYEQHQEKHQQQMRAYSEQNRDKIKEYNKAYKEQNRDKIKEYNKAYQAQNREKIRECRRGYRERKREEKKIALE